MNTQEKILCRNFLGYLSLSCPTLKGPGKVCWPKKQIWLTDRHISYTMVLQITCGEQGWRSVESDRLTPMRSGFGSRQVSHLGGVCRWFSPWPERFSPFFYSFPPSNISKFEFDQDRGAAWKPARVDVNSSLNIAASFYYVLCVFFVCCMPLTW